MITLATGLIAGLKLGEHLEKAVKYANNNGISLKLINFVIELGKTNEKDYKFYLDQNDYALEPTRKFTYSKIKQTISEIHKRSKNANIIVRVPATVEYDHINIKFKDHKIIKETINPDLIVTFIDAEWLIQKRFREEYKEDPYLYSLVEYFKNFTVEEILDWIDEEVSLSEDWAEYMNIPHVVIAVGQPIESIIKLTTVKNVPKFYASYPMTHATPEERKQINKIIKRLDRHGVVVDPAAIEIDQKSKMSPEEKRAVYEYTVHRDLHWDVKKVDALVGIQPSKDKPAFSWGMTSEIEHARGYGKEIYVFKPKEGSPFGPGQAFAIENWFDTEEKLFKSISKKYPQLNLKKKTALYIKGSGIN